MPREILNEIDVSRGDDLSGAGQATLSWGWELGGVNTAAATIGINQMINGEWHGSGVGLGYGDLERLNRAVRRAMKHYRKAYVPSELPTIEPAPTA